MLHELLVALAGNCGGIFRDTGEKGIQVLNDIPFVHTSEVQVLNDLCKLGTHFKDIQKFVEKHGTLLSVHNSGLQQRGEPHGLYLKAFCVGLSSVLQNYQMVLVTLEAEALADPHLPLSHVVGKLHEYGLLFPILASVIQQIITHKAHGCYILEVVHKNAMCGLPIVSQALRQVLQACHAVLFKQLTMWLLHGVLVDSYCEFFIQKADSDTNLSTKPPSKDDSDLDSVGLTGRQLQQLMSLDSVDVPTAGVESQLHFALRADLLPSYVPLRVAQKILFVGESVRMLEKERNKSVKQDPGGILTDREVHFSRRLHQLSQLAEFNAMAFESVIDEIRVYVAEHLWFLVVEKADLLGQLRVMKDLFLLGRGELYLALIDKVHPLLDVPPTPTTQHDVNMAYRLAARDILLEDEALLQRFRLTITSKQDSKKKMVDGLTDSGTGTVVVESGWSCLGLTCTVPWPLHIFFTPAMLTKYDCLFRFLLAVRRTQTDLQHCWMLQMQKKNGHTSQEESTVWQLRNHMAFLVDNLQYYLQVDVIEAQYSILVDKISNTRDFETVKLAHEQFLATLLSQCFLQMKTIFNCLQEILGLCNTFSRLVAGFQSPLPARQMEQLLRISQNFQNQSSLLFRIMSSVRSYSASGHLAQLLLRLDFNKFFTTSY